MTDYFSVGTIAYGRARQAVAHVMEAAVTGDVPTVAIVVDPGLVLVAADEANGAPPHSVETSRRKAVTASSTRQPGGAIRPGPNVALEHDTGGVLTSISGRSPIAVDGVHVGGRKVPGGRPTKHAEIALAPLVADTAELQR